MIRRLVSILILSCVFHVSGAVAADVPFTKLNKKSTIVKPKVNPAPLQRTSAVKKKKSDQSQPAAAAKVAVKEARIAPAPEKQQAVVAPEAPSAIGREIELPWVLDPLVANADHSKKEGSASAETNLVVLEPGSVSAPYMQIELNGHVVKTSKTTARIDVRVGQASNSFVWSADDIHAGRFKKTFRASMKEGKLPAYIPVSAIALVTNDGKSGAVMVSLEKIVVRVGSVVLAQTQ